ncbi:MAG: hypothetical protein Kow00121_55700 [Elainellaceae cyanobacterium]
MDLQTAGVTIAAIVRQLNGVLIGICQLLALFVIFIGIIRALVIYLKGIVNHASAAEAFQKSRLTMGYAFSLGLSFLIGSTILKTMISSRWDDIARLAAIIAVRTVINYLLLQAISAGDRTVADMASQPPESPAFNNDGVAAASASKTPVS